MNLSTFSILINCTLVYWIEVSYKRPEKLKITKISIYTARAELTSEQKRKIQQILEAQQDDLERHIIRIKIYKTSKRKEVNDKKG